MEKLLFILLFLVLITNISALDCQYTEMEPYEEFEFGLYDSSGDFVGPPLEFKDFVGGSMNIQGCNPPSFKIYNPLDNKITLNISYMASWNTAFGSSSPSYRSTISINKNSNSEKIQGSCPDLGGGSILEESINYLIVSPEIMTLENELVKKQRDVCKVCPSGKQCLDDGVSCEFDNECGAGICNPNNKCGSFENGCSGGTHLCGDKCLLPSIKQTNEAYSCEFECESQRGNGDVCILGEDQEAFWTRIKNIFFGVLILAGLSLIGYFILWKKVKPTVKKYDESKKGLEEVEKEVKKLEGDKKRLEGDLIFLNSELKSLEDDKKDSEERMINLRKKIKKAGEEAKEKLEEKLEEAERIQKLRIDRIKEKEKEINSKKLKVNSDKNKLSKALSERNRLAEQSIINTQKEVDASLKKYQREYSRQTIKYDNERNYFVFSSNNEPLHRYRYRKMYNLGEGYKVHHIDKNKLNNEYWNLIALTKEEHDKIEHGSFFFKDWGRGILELKRRIPEIERRFHKEIKKKLKKKK